MIDNRIVEQARNTDIIDFLERYCGFTFTRRSGAYRCDQHPSLVVRNDHRAFYWHSKGIGGFGTLDYLIKVENMTFRKAVETVAGATPQVAPKRQGTGLPKTLMLPEKADVPLRLYDYLCVKRGIDTGIVSALIQKGKLYEDRRCNVVFVEYDEQGKARFASLRGTYGLFRGDLAGSSKQYGFTMTSCVHSECLYIFESAIDSMSYASLLNSTTGDVEAWKRNNHLSLAGTSDVALIFFLKKHSAVKYLVFCLDNDSVGREASVNMARKYAAMGFMTRIELPSGKDFNVDLQMYRKLGKVEKYIKTYASSIRE